jgi:hypothetical protein
MADDGNKALTEAQLQIERLRLLKEKKDVKASNDRKETFSFMEPRHIETADASSAQESAPVPEKEESRTAESATRPAARKQRVCRLDRRNFDRMNAIVKNMKDLNPGLRLSTDMLLNMMITEIIDLNIDFSTVKTSAELKEALHKIKV